MMMSDKTIQNDEVKKETTLRKYLKKRINLLPLLVASFILIDIVVLFISENYTFTEMFYLCGIVLILLAVGSSIIVLLEADPFWAYICAFIFGLIPIIEIIIHLSTVPQDIISLVLAIVTIFLAIALICFLVLVVPLYHKRKAEKMEG